MNIREVLHIVGALLVWTAAAMVPAAVFALSEDLFIPWAWSAAVTAAVGVALWFAKPRDVSINPREGIVVVGLGWIAIVSFGSLPFIFTGATHSVAAAFFESASGFTTTGATIFPVMEELPRSILLWRSISHWLGGMGIIVLGVAILPLIGMGGAQLFRAEAPGIATDRLKPRIATTARLLWVVYAILTAMLGVLYLVMGMGPFDAVNHAMSAMATGGFSTRTASLGYYSGAIQWVTVVFMFAAGINFTLHFRLMTGKLDAWIRDPEWRWYFASTVGVAIAAFVTVALAQSDWSLGTLRHAVFNVVAVHSTTGFATTDFAAWPVFGQVMLLGLMFVGAMGGSTGGGFKVVRAAVVTQHARGEIRKVLHPRAVLVTRLGRHPVRSDIVLNVLAFLTLYMFTHAIGTAALAVLGSDLVTAVSAALAAMSSIGPGLGEVGPADNYAHMGSAAQVVLSLLMLLGRLEFYTLLVLVMPGTWTRSGGHR